eukprot:CCRYP_012781-RA/>CCRYP_012781-RA protein AED:0.02 eAED:0.02 QI:2/1/1/1/0.5/0.66/3/597/569
MAKLICFVLVLFTSTLIAPKQRYRNDHELVRRSGPIQCHEMKQSELDPLIRQISIKNYFTDSNSLRERRTGRTSPSPPTLDQQMHFPQHHQVDRPVDEHSHDSVAATATRGPSRQLFYRDRIPQLPSESRDYARSNVPVVSSESTDSSSSPDHQHSANQPQTPSQYQQHNFAFDGTRLGIPGSAPLQQTPRIPSPQPMHNEYRDQLHRNRLVVSVNPGLDSAGRTHGRFIRGENGTLVEVSEEVYAVRKAALSVLDPITYCWLILTIGFSMSVALGAAKWTVALHIMSARALSRFISEANENRQRPDSTDHLDRVEYLPLLQRSLKFGLKTGFLCFVVFIFEILLFVRLSNPSRLSLTVTYIPLWILTLGSIGNGVVCKSQHFVYVLIWVLIVAAMVLSVLKIDYGMYQIDPSYIIIVIQSMLGIISGTLVYVINGHQIGYFKLTDSQLTAGVFYASSSFLAILLVAIMADTLSLPELIQLDFQLITVILAPLVVAMAGIGAYLVTRGEFERLLKFGGQSAVIPMKLRLEANGWTCVESKGITSIPMFGDVRFVSYYWSRNRCIGYGYP